MNNEELSRRLKSAPVPSADEAAKSRAIQRARMMFENAPRIPEREAPFSRFGYLRMVLEGAVLASLVLWMTAREPDQYRDGSFAGPQQLRLLRETSMLFPQGIKAVVERNGDSSIVVNQEESGSAPYPLAIELKRNGETVRILTFSGEEVEITIGGTTYSLEALVTSSGSLVVMGNDFLWNGEQSTLPDGTSIEVAEL